MANPVRAYNRSASSCPPSTIVQVAFEETHVFGVGYELCPCRVLVQLCC